MRHVICMVSDFFYPNLGGIESHIFALSLCLIKLGHKVVVVTHSYGDRVGVRYMTNGLKVYYLPMQTMADQVVLPTVYASLPWFRQIFIREQVGIVHGHSAFSSLAQEGILIAKLMKLKAVFTDHSLNGFSDASATLTNKLLEITLSGVDRCICVSSTGRKNTSLRAKVPLEHICAIPNATDSTLFTPDLAKRDQEKITIVAMSRLVYRKGIDLLVKVIPKVCDSYPKVHFLIGGDGPKRVLLEQLRERQDLHERIDLLGSLDPSQVRDTLQKGHIFLNTSLTEAFCIAIIEAASCGLQVVSTNVGAIPEVLPQDMLRLAEPTVDGICSTLDDVIKAHLRGDVPDPYKCHEYIKEKYNWSKIAESTVEVYDDVHKIPATRTADLYSKYLKCGLIAGPFFVILFAIFNLILLFYEWYIPREQIDIAPDYPSERSEKSATQEQSSDPTSRE